MIKEWDYFNKNFHFENIKTTYSHPCDIDLFYVEPNNEYVIFGEIKHEYGSFKDKQRNMYESMVNESNFQHAIAIFITYSEKIEDGCKDIDVSKCKVAEYLIKGNKGWKKPNKQTTVQDVFNYAAIAWKKGD